MEGNILKTYYETEQLYNTRKLFGNRPHKTLYSQANRESKHIL